MPHVWGETQVVPQRFLRTSCRPKHQDCVKNHPQNPYIMIEQPLLVVSKTIVDIIEATYSIPWCTVVSSVVSEHVDLTLVLVTSSHSVRVSHRIPTMAEDGVRIPFTALQIRSLIFIHSLKLTKSVDWCGE